MGRLKSKLVQYYLGLDRTQKRRRSIEKKRRRAGAPHQVSYFHQVDDPYSHLVAQVLDTFQARYDIDLQCYLVGAPSKGAAPELELLQSYGRRDAARLARHYGLEFHDNGWQPEPGHVASANNGLTEAMSSGEFVSKAVSIGRDLWSGQLVAEPINDFAEHAISDGEALREKLGHYSGGMLHYGGEWYWGIDRLHYLEDRLRALGAGNADGDLICPVPSAPNLTIRNANTIDFYASLRSPYTYLASQQIFEMARAHGAEVNIKPVLPMVMRSLPVPVAKRLYIVRDVKRQAERLSIPFGSIADPVGRPVERGMAILFYAIDRGKGEAFLTSFLKAVWADGIDAGKDKGLKVITERAGLSWHDVKPALIDEKWRATAEQNREDMFELGLWGVPSFRVGDLAVWGEDRLWQVRQELIK